MWRCTIIFQLITETIAYSAVLLSIDKLVILHQRVKMLGHVNTFVEQIEGGLNKRGSDQVTEAAHQLLHRRMTISNYFVRKVGTEAEGRKLFRAVVHTNAYNM